MFYLIVSLILIWSLGFIGAFLYNGFRDALCHRDVPEWLRVLAVIFWPITVVILTAIYFLMRTLFRVYVGKWLG